MKVLSIQPSAKKQGSTIQHLDFIEATKAIGVEHHLALQKNHPLDQKFSKHCTDILGVEDIRGGILPRTPSPTKLIKFYLFVLQLTKQICAFSKDNKIGLIWTVDEALPACPLSARKLGAPSVTHVFESVLAH